MHKLIGQTFFQRRHTNNQQLYETAMKFKDACSLGKKAMTNLDSILKSRDITLSTKVHLVKAMVFPVVLYGCESWTIKKAESESEVAQSCPTLCDPVHCSPPSSSVHGIFQARVLEWVAISFSRGSSRPRDQTQVSCIVRKTLYLLSHQGSPIKKAEC